MSVWNPRLLNASVAEIDPLMANVLREEAKRQRYAISLLAPSMLMPCQYGRHQQGLELEFGGTDTHMLLLRLRTPTPPIVSFLESTGILTNSNMLPGDTKPSEALGIRIGTIGVTQRHLTEQAAKELGSLIADVIDRATNSRTAADLGHCRTRVQSFAQQQFHSPEIFLPGYC